MSETAVQSAKSASSADRKRPRQVDAKQRACLFQYWKEISASRADELDERAARLAYANEKLRGGDSGSREGKAAAPIASWNDLTRAEAGKLIYAMRVDLGRDVAAHERGKATPDALEIIARLALELYGPDWHDGLRERLKLSPYFHFEAMDSITPYQSHVLIEDLLDHWERELFPGDALTSTRKQRKEELRKRFGKRRSRGARRPKTEGQTNAVPHD